MPEVYDPVAAYQHYVVDINTNRTFVSDGNTYWGGLKTRIDNYFTQNPTELSPASQFQRDVAFWYGAWRFSAKAETRNILQRVFATLYHGGLMVRRQGTWVAWATLGIPIAAIISHTARVTIQLPKLVTGQAWTDFWGWLYPNPRARWAATHGFAYDAPAQEDVRNRPKHIRETKKAGPAHFYLNIGLGGFGNKNPFSGKQISEDDGRHGHLYFCYRAPTLTQFGGLLIATEQSAPLDRAPGKGFTSTLSNLGHRGIPDQYGGKHGLGGHNHYSATCGEDWTKDNLAGYGPDVYLDGMYIDLSVEHVCKAVYNSANTVTPDKLGDTGNPPLPNTPPPVFQGL